MIIITAAVTNALMALERIWEDVAATAAEDRQRWRQRVAQASRKDAGRIKVKVKVYADVQHVRFLLTWTY